MAAILAKLRNLLNGLTDRSPPRRPAGDQIEALPPVLSAGDMMSLYYLTMADREAAWYFDRR